MNDDQRTGIKRMLKFPLHRFGVALLIIMVTFSWSRLQDTTDFVPTVTAQGTGFLEDLSVAEAFRPELTFSAPPELNQATDLVLSIENVAAVGLSNASIQIPGNYAIQSIDPANGSVGTGVGNYSQVSWSYQPTFSGVDDFSVTVIALGPSDLYDSVYGHVREAVVGSHDPEEARIWARVGVPGIVQADVVDEMPEEISVKTDPYLGQAPTHSSGSDTPLTITWDMTTTDPVNGFVNASIIMTNTSTSPVVAGMSFVKPSGWVLTGGSTPQVLSLLPGQTTQRTFLMQASATPGSWSASLLVLLDSATVSLGYAPYFIVQEGSTDAGGPIDYLAQTRYLQPSQSQQLAHGIPSPGVGSANEAEPPPSTDANLAVAELIDALDQGGGDCLPEPPPTCCAPLIIHVGAAPWFSAWTPAYGIIIVAPQVTVSGSVTMDGFHNPWGDPMGATNYDGTDLRVRILTAPGRSSYLFELKRGLTNLNGDYMFCIPILPGARAASGNVPVVVELSSVDTAELGEDADAWEDYSARAFRYIEARNGETRLVWREFMPADIPLPKYYGTACNPVVPQGGQGLASGGEVGHSVPEGLDSDPCSCQLVPNFELPTLNIEVDNSAGFFIASFIAENVRGFMLDPEHFGVCIHAWQGNGRGFPVTTFNPAPGTGPGRLPNNQGRIWYAEGAEWDMWTISHEWAHFAHDVVSPTGVGHTQLREGFATAFSSLMEEQPAPEGWRGEPERNEATLLTDTSLEGHTGTGGTPGHSFQNYRDMGAYFWDLHDDGHDAMPNCTTGLMEPLDAPSFADVFRVLDAGPQTMTEYYDQWIMDHGDTPEFGAVSLNHVITADPEPICVP